jgi:uncharacterized protein YdhG (YjbR/CyaY superfamily)
VAPLVEAGATVLREPGGDIGWHVLADSEGNEFLRVHPVTTAASSRRRRGSLRTARTAEALPLSKLRSLAQRLIDQQNGAVSAKEIDQYLDALEEPKRTTLAGLRQMILEILPEADQGISYGVPAFKVRGKTIAGFAAFKTHLSYLPHSGSVFPQLKDELKGYSTSSGALRFGIDEPLPAPLVEKLIAVRLQQASPSEGP